MISFDHSIIIHSDDDDDHGLRTVFDFEFTQLQVWFAGNV